MNLRVEQRTLAQSDQDHVVVLGPNPADATPTISVSPRDRRPLQRARDLMIADLARPWTLDELARDAGLTQKRLKTGFKAMYGYAVYAFLQEQRLLEGRRLIESGEMNVTQAALAVGYGNPSHFSQLFLRRFGTQPSRLRAVAVA